MDMSSLYLQPEGQVHGVCDPQWNGLSLQEMIDSDIKAEFDDVMRDDPLDLQDMDLELLNDLGNFDSPFGRYEIGSELSTGSELTLSSTHHWVESGGGSLSSTSSTASDQLSPDFGSLEATRSALNNSYFEDLNGANNVMVNPSSVMPVHTSQPSRIISEAKHVKTVISSQVANPHRHGSVIKIQTTNHSNAIPAVASSVTYPSIIMPIYTTTVASQTPGSCNTIHVGPRLGKTVKVIPPISSPMQVNSPQHIQQRTQIHQQIHNINNKHSASKKKSLSHNSSLQKPAEKENGFPKPAYSYSCLIALALKNSQNGSMSVSEIYKFMCEHFPYFKTAPTGWKNSVRHNLSLNKCFEKIEKPSANGTNQRKGCLWAINPAKVTKMDDEVQKWSRKDPMAIKKGMLLPHTLESLERGEMVKDYSSNGTASSCGSIESEDEEDPRTPASVSSQGSHGYDSAGSDFVDIETFTSVPDSSLPELNLQVSSGNGGGIYEELGDDRLHFGTATIQDNQYFLSNTSIQGNYSIVTPHAKPSPGGTLIVQKRDCEKVLGI
ncbi:uncharacterized protein [Lepeophtheirus salmonis]|uniref:uncharacterized protein n=1 Tax=Lepeophtheirus salmonis TaxID=72036 RepID=UPI001AE546E5|nr:forkhead box protein O1-B-like [Lepeophtheirus salmonis]